MTLTQPPVSPRLARAAALLMFALVALWVTALHSYHFAGRNYRDDEIRTVHAGMTLSPREVLLWMSRDIHPPLWRVTATTWVSLFGPDERVTRFLSSLYAALALALLYRLAADMFDQRVALVAALLLGTQSLFQFYGHELRPYSALVMWLCGAHLWFTRWVARPGFHYALLFVAFAGAALYTHFFALYALAGIAVAFLVVARWNVRKLARAAALFVLAGLLFLGWLPSFLHSFLVTRPGGVPYGVDANLSGLLSLYRDVMPIPFSLGNLLFGMAVLLPLARYFPASHRRSLWRFGADWGKLYLLIAGMVIVISAFLTDAWTDVLTRRNIIVTLPLLAILAAVGLRVLPRQGALVAVVMIVVAGVAEFERYDPNMPYRETLAVIKPEYEPHTPIILSLDPGFSDYFGFAYYYMSRMSGHVNQDDFFSITDGLPRLNLPEPMQSHITRVDTDSVERFNALLNGHDRVWWVWSNAAVPIAAQYEAILLQDFTLYKETDIEDPTRSYNYDYFVREYWRTGR